MSKYEQKNCPLCDAAFECKAGNLSQCQCYGVMVPDEARRWMEKNFIDCLCRECLLDIENKMKLAQTANFAEKAPSTSSG